LAEQGSDFGFCAGTGGFANGSDDAQVPGATAQVAHKGFAYFGLGRIGIAVE
jgi:hypothetical protein